VGSECVEIRWRIEPEAFAPEQTCAPIAPGRGAGSGERTGLDEGGDRSGGGGSDAPPLAPRPTARSHRGHRERDGAHPERFHRLEDFIVGASNRLAYEAARRLGEGERDGFGALCLYGVCGVGKTHLLQGVARRYRERHPGAEIRYTTAERFANEYIALICEGKADEFRKRYRRLDLLCLDDVHFLSGKKSTQSEFLHTFETLELAGARVVIASDEHPKVVRDLSASIVSRVSSGMVVEIERPDREMRVRLVRAIAAKRGLALDDGAVAEIAGACLGSVREIEGAVMRVDAFSRLLTSGAPQTERVGVSTVRQVMAGECSRRPRRPIRVSEVLEAVCEVVRVEASDVLGPGRHRRIVLARSLVARASRELTSHSFPEIARALNRRNHSTIVTACQRIERQIARGDTVRDEPSLREVRIADLYDEVRARLLGRGA
jgi:chromosomal replication initiator protein